MQSWPTVRQLADQVAEAADNGDAWAVSLLAGLGVTAAQLRNATNNAELVISLQADLLRPESTALVRTHENA